MPVAAGENRHLAEGYAIGHGGEDFQGAVAAFDGDAELHAFDEAAQAFGVVALRGADQALGDDALFVRQCQHDAAIQSLDAQIHPVIGMEGIGDHLKRIIHIFYLSM